MLKRIKSIEIDDTSLEPYISVIEDRHAYMEKYITDMLDGRSLTDFASDYRSLGFFREKRNEKVGVVFREWAPAAEEMYLVGDFNSWNQESVKCKRLENNIFEVFIPDDAEQPIYHLSKVKVLLLHKDKEGEMKKLFRVPSHIHYAVPDPLNNKSYVGVYWDFSVHNHLFNVPFRQSPHVLDRSGLRIYECHVGMAGEDPEISSYSYFQYSVLPRVIKDGYNCIQFMAVVEHAYYASFGYHCNMFYATSSRYGTPTDFQRLVDAVHQAGLFVIIDIVQSHASPNTGDGLNQFDGSDNHYFAKGEAGNHRLWGSKCFDYKKREVVQFLLGQLLYFVDFFHVDGFRFDGVTSMMYHDHAIVRGFSGDYRDYFGFHSNVGVSFGKISLIGNHQINLDALAYLAMANNLLHALQPPCFSIAEDVSGYPLLASPIQKGGVGFDYRMNMAVADKWIQLLKEQQLTDWNVNDLVYTITNRRIGERYITYNECHDQSLVGDKTLAFWLMDATMYTGMSRLLPKNNVISTGIRVLHLIRLLTKTLGGEGYLNFMGNEFGHPEWIDFPREGNHYSFQHCRRQWHLVDDKNLLYQFIHNWDVETNHLCVRYYLQTDGFEYITQRDEHNQVIAYEKGSLLFVYNFSCTNSYSDYRVAVRNEGEYRCILSSDLPEYYGENRVSLTSLHYSQPNSQGICMFFIQVYCPTLTVNIYRRVY